MSGLDTDNMTKEERDQHDAKERQREKEEQASEPNPMA